MNSLKTFLIQHGEKLVLAAVAIICVLSIVGMLSRDSRVLRLPDGREVRVDQDELRLRIEQAEQHLKSGHKVKPDPVAEKVSHDLARKISEGFSGAGRVNLEWFAYVQPVPVGVPPLFAKPEAKAARNIPQDYRTRFGNPAEVRVLASVDRILVVCRDSEYLNYPEPGSRQMLLWRKAIGSGKEGLDPALRRALLRSPRSAQLQAAAAPAGGGAAAAEGTGRVSTDTATAGAIAGWEAYGGVRAAEPTAKVREEMSPDIYRQRWQEADRRAHEDMMLVCKPADIVETGWELVTQKMYALRSEPTEEILRSILEGNITPELVVMSDEEVAEFKKKQTQPEEKQPEAAAEPDTVDWSNIVAPRVDVKKPDPSAAVVAAPSETAAPQYYVFVDRNIQQNMLYRYAMIASVRPRMPEKELLEKEEYQGWDIYCEVAGINGVPPGGGDFAPPARVVKPFFESSMPAKLRGVVGPRDVLRFIPCYTPVAAAEVKDAATAGAAGAAGAGAAGAASAAGATRDDAAFRVRTAELRDDKGRLTPLGWAYRNQEPCYSDMVYTDIVLTPNEFELELRAALGAPNPQATIRVHRVDAAGEVQSFNVTVIPPTLANSPRWADFLAKDATGQAAWPPKLLTLQEVYSGLGGLQPAPIVGKPPRGAEVNTGWGVVEIRPFVIRGVIERLKDGQWTKLGDLPERRDFAVIITELNPPEGQPRRFNRLFKAAPESTNPERRFVYDYVWEPELQQNIEAKRKQMEGGR